MQSQLLHNNPQQQHAHYLRLSAPSVTLKQLLKECKNNSLEYDIWRSNADQLGLLGSCCLENLTHQHPKILLEHLLCGEEF